MDDRERLLADVSHELRSPLARMKVALELLPAGEKNDSIAQDIRSMESLITALLEREQVRARISQDVAGQDEAATINLVAVTCAPTRWRCCCSPSPSPASSAGVARAGLALPSATPSALR